MTNTNLTPPSAAPTKYTLHHGDCLDVLKSLPANSVDAIVTDPPAGINFMGKDWDKDKGGRDKWVAWMTEISRECIRVIKPGGHALVWAIGRTSHWTGWAWEDAGWEVREKITHLNGQGFPKSLDVSKALDKQAGAEREVVGSKVGQPGYSVAPGKGRNTLNSANDGSLNNSDAECQITAPSTDAAKKWDGWGTALKPSSEDWWMFRKPLEGTVAANVLAHGTGALNIDGCRIGCESRPINNYSSEGAQGCMSHGEGKGHSGKEYTTTTVSQGRWPANAVLSHNEDCVEVGTRKVKTGTATFKNTDAGTVLDSYSGGLKRQDHGEYGHADPDGTETVPAWDCTPDCPVRMLDEQSLAGGMHSAGAARDKTVTSTYEASSYDLSGPRPMGRLGDTGGASRFFYCAKASKGDRGEGNNHPTVKSQSLMVWLCRLICPPGGTILDPFLGSGTTGIAALLEGFRFIGIEKELPYFEIAKGRIENYNQPKAAPKAATKVEGATEGKNPTTPDTGSILDMFG